MLPTQLLESFDDQLDDLLTRICRKLQITKTQEELAAGRYGSVSDWLSRPESPFAQADTNIYPQGSLRIGTTVKPLARQEFDLDVVCQLNMPQGMAPLDLLNLLERRLLEHGQLAPLVDPKKRCIRLNYAGDFHLDIMPCLPDPAKGNGCVLVPDREIKGWSPSNPKGFADWFEAKAWTPRLRVLDEELKMAALKVETDPLPASEPVGLKPPLKLAVQLLKRHRDVRFAGKPDKAPISVVLTTLAAIHYDGSERVGRALGHLLDASLQLTYAGDGRPFAVPNPMNPEEDFAERWHKDPRLYREFREWIAVFQAQWKEILAPGSLPERIGKLKEMFGEVATVALKDQVEAIRAAQDSGRLGVTLGGVLTADAVKATPAPSHSFHLSG